MPVVNGGPIGPDGLGGAYKNTDADDRAALWRSLGAKQGLLSGGALTTPAGSLSMEVAAFRAAVAERDAAGVQLDRGYHAWADTTTTVVFDTPSASSRNDAVVLAVADVSAGAGAFGTGVTEAGPQVLVVTGVSGITVPRTDTEIQDWVGSGGWVRLADAVIAPTDTEVNDANVTAADVDVSPLFIQSGTVQLTVTAGGGNVTVVFPEPFADTPVMSVNYVDGNPESNTIGLGLMSATQADIAMDGTNNTYTVHWIAIGKRA